MAAPTTAMVMVPSRPKSYCVTKTLIPESSPWETPHTYDVTFSRVESQVLITVQDRSLPEPTTTASEIQFATGVIPDWAMPYFPNVPVALDGFNGSQAPISMWIAGERASGVLQAASDGSLTIGRLATDASFPVSDGVTGFNSTAPSIAYTKCDEPMSASVPPLAVFPSKVRRIHRVM